MGGEGRVRGSGWGLIKYGWNANFHLPRPRQIYVTLRDERREAAVVAAERKAAEQDRL